MNRRRSVMRSGLLVALAHALVPPAGAQEPADSTIADLISRIEGAQEAPEAGSAAQVALQGAHILDDFDLNRLTLLRLTDIRLVRNLSLNLFGSVSHIADQRNLHREGGHRRGDPAAQEGSRDVFSVHYVRGPQLHVRLDVQADRAGLV